MIFLVSQDLIIINEPFFEEPLSIPTQHSFHNTLKGISSNQKSKENEKEECEHAPVDVLI